MDVLFYRSGSGNEPVREWLKGLAKQDKKVIGEDIKTVQYGWPIGMPVVRKLDNRLWEIRSHLDKRIARVLFTVYSGNMILLHGFYQEITEDTSCRHQTGKRAQGRSGGMQ